MRRCVQVTLGGCVWGLFFSFFPQFSGATKFDELILRIPDTANAIVALDVEAVFDSDLARSEGWKAKYAERNAATPLKLPPGARRFLLGAELEIGSMHSQWEVAAMEMSTKPTAKEVLQMTGGILDSVSGTDTIWPNSDTCIAKFTDHEFGVFSPTNRKTAARWIDRSKRQENASFSPYLRQAIEYTGGAGPEIVMAIDLEDIVRPDEIRAAVQKAELVRDLDEGDVTEVLSSFRGVTLGVRVTDRIDGKLIVDFGKDAAVLEPIAKTLILNVLANAGATLDEFDDWKPKIRGNRVSLTGPLTTDGMRRLFSLVNLDSAIVNRQVAEAAPSEPPEQDLVGQASLRYFQAITKYLNDVQRPNIAKNTWAGKEMWLTNYARKIDRMWKSNVDPDLVSYGDTISGLLRDAVALIQGTIGDVDYRTSRVNPVTGVRVGVVPTWRTRNYGGYRQREYVPMAFANVDVAGAMQERDDILREGDERLAAESDKIENEIRYATDEIRKQMSDRYDLEF